MRAPHLRRGAWTEKSARRDDPPKLSYLWPQMNAVFRFSAPQAPAKYPRFEILNMVFICPP